MKQGRTTCSGATSGTTYDAVYSGQGFIHYKSLAPGEYDFKTFAFRNQPVLNDQTAVIQLRGKDQALTLV